MLKKQGLLLAFSFFLLFSSSANALAGEAQNEAAAIWVYKADGSRQCGTTDAVPLGTMQRELAVLGAVIVRSEQRALPHTIMDFCGAPTAMVNAYLLTAETAESVLSENGKRRDFARWVFDDKSVEVFKYDGTRQCSADGEISVPVMRGELERAEILVITARKDGDRKTHYPLCGAGTGKVNVYEIPQETLERALNLGFRVL